MTHQPLGIIVRAALVSARQALHDYRRAAVLLAAAAALALAAAGPVMLLADASAAGVGLRLQPAPLGGTEPVLDAAARSVAATRQGAVDTLSIMLLALAAATLAVGIVTIAALSATRESERAAELSVRRAVGAGHRTLVAAALLEGGGLALIGLAIGAAAGAVLWREASGSWPGSIRAAVHGGAIGGIAVFALVVAVAGSVLLPVAFPRRRIAQMDSAQPTPLAPAAIQLGLSLIALTGGTLVTRQAARWSAAPPTAPDGSVLTLTPADTTAAARAETYRALLARLAERAAPGSVSLTAPGTLLGLGPVSEVTTDCGACSEGGLFVPWRVKPATYQFLSADTFRLMRVGIVAGRGITGDDRWGAPRVAVVSRSLAAREFQDGAAIGRRIKVAGAGSEWSTVVGIVEDSSPAGLGGASEPSYAVYLSVLQYPPPSVDLLVRAPPGVDTAESVRPALEATLGGPIRGGWRSESSLRADEARPLRWFGQWLAWEGWAMLLIATLGAAALMHLWVRSLAAELGVRRAVGARRWQVLGFVLLRAMAVGAAGVAVALWFGPPVWGILPTFLTGAAPWAPSVIAKFAALLVSCVLLAGLPPARHAARAPIVQLIGSGGT